MRLLILCCILVTELSFANPYWDPQQVPKDANYPNLQFTQVDINTLKPSLEEEGIAILRIQTDWREDSESYKVSHIVLESSGTSALLARSIHKPRWGSYVGILKSKASGKTMYYDSIGTGKEYRKLARAINLRFPAPAEDVVFVLYAENPQSGLMEKVIEEEVQIGNLNLESKKYADFEVRELALASKSPSLRVNIYAEGYKLKDKNKFYKLAIKTVQALQSQEFPGIEYMSFYAVYSSSNKTLDRALDLGLPVPEFDSFLGLYYPYWDNFGRWYHIVYPTRENKFRQALASAPYDYPIVLVNNDEYWGVGNFKSHTAIPADNSENFTYLLLHEIGHFFGLNEEYQGGGRTELEFAEEIDEPWSQNITFLSTPSHQGLKWNEFVSYQTSIPTPRLDWDDSPPIYGAYKGGYADSRSSKWISHKPGLKCTMERDPEFCRICKKGILDVVEFDLGLKR